MPISCINSSSKGGIFSIFPLTPINSRLTIPKDEAHLSSNVIFDNSTSIFPKSESSFPDYAEHSASSTAFQSASNTQWLGVVSVGVGAESLGLTSAPSYYASSDILEEFMYPDLTGISAENGGFDWSGQQQQPTNFLSPIDHFDLLRNFHLGTSTADVNEGYMSAAGPSNFE
jgi:hypothetical protein